MAKKRFQGRKNVIFGPVYVFYVRLKKSDLNFLREKMNERGKELIFTAGG
jgi:hypothetical protein